MDRRTPHAEAPVRPSIDTLKGEHEHFLQGVDWKIPHAAITHVRPGRAHTSEDVLTPHPTGSIVSISGHRGCHATSPPFNTAARLIQRDGMCQHVSTDAETSRSGTRRFPGDEPSPERPGERLPLSGGRGQRGAGTSTADPSVPRKGCAGMWPPLGAPVRRAGRRRRYVRVPRAGRTCLS